MPFDTSKCKNCIKYNPGVKGNCLAFISNKHPITDDEGKCIARVPMRFVYNQKNPG